MDLPIDIPYAKTIDWLVERRVLSSTWSKTLRTAHSKLEGALEAERPPVDGVTAIVPAGRTQQSTTYFECAQVLELLKGAGLDEKSFLGAYTNPHTARWADVIKRFESGSVYLADAAQYLVHQCAYELPALKKELARAERELAELQKRQAEYMRLAEASRTRFTQACAKRRIREIEDEPSLRDELRFSLSQLRPTYEQVAALVQQEPLPSAVMEYKALVAYALETAAETAATATADASGGGGKAGKKGKGAASSAVAVSGGAGAASERAPLLPILTTVQQMDLNLEGAAAAAAAGGANASSATGGDGAAVEIDWGGMEAEEGGGGGGAAAVEVDWGAAMEVGDDAEEVAEIDWGGGMGGGGGGGVDWGDGGMGGGDAEGGVVEIEEFDFEVEESGEGVEADEGALSLARIFEQPTARHQFLDDLFELQAFFVQYAAELAGGASAAALPSEQQLDAKEVQARLHAVSGTIEMLDCEHTRHLLLLGSSERYLGMQVASLRQMLDSAEKMRRRAEELQTRQAELKLTIQDSYPKYDSVVASIKRVKDELEGALSKHFNGRKVNLMGDINSL